MLKKTITFDDMDGNSVTEDFYFNLSRAEILEMELSETGGLTKKLERVAATQDPGKILTAFKEIVTKSVGRRSEDGRRFIKSDEITDEFLQSEAWSEMFIELLKDSNAAAAFVEGLLPQKLIAEVKAQAGTETVPLPAAPAVTPPWILEGRDPNTVEFQTMTSEQMAEAFRAKQARQSPNIKPYS